MGNERTLKMIAAASAKLKRIDPDFAINVATSRKKARHESRLQRIAKAAIEYNADLQRLVTKNNAPLDPEYEQSIGDLTTQDNILFDIFSIDSGKPSPPLEVNEKNVRVYSHDGHTLTIPQWAKRTGISETAIRHRISSGYSIREAIDNSKSENDRRKMRSSGCNFKAKQAKTYTNAGSTMTLKAWSIATGILQSTLATRLSSGWTLNDALTQSVGSYKQPKKQRAPRPKRKYIYAGLTKTLEEWALFTGINVGTLQTRIYVGWPMHRVFTSKLNAKNGYKDSGELCEIDGGWVETLKNDQVKDRPHSLDIQPKQEIFQ